MSPNWFQAHIQKVLSEGVQLNFVLFFACFCIFVCLVDEGGESPNTTTSGSLSARQ